MRKRSNISRKWLEKHNAPLSFSEWFKNTLSAIVNIEALVSILQRLGKSDWEGWLLIQELGVTETAIQGGANISVCDSLVLRWSAQNGHVELMKLLVEKGADLRSFNNLLLFLAAERGHLKMVKYLLVKGLDIHAQNDCALRWTVKKANLELAKFLKKKGANVDGLLEQARQTKDEKTITFLEKLK